MKRYVLALSAALPLLGGCTPAETKTIGQVAGGSLTVACTVFGVAKGYFEDRLAKNSATNIAIGNAAIAGFASICPPNPPPINVTSALVDLNTFWTALQAATTIPVMPPTPTPTTN